MHYSDQDCCRREKIKFAWYSRFKEPKLYKFAVRGDWEFVPKRCQTHPEEAQFVHKYPPSDTALHRILRNAALSMVEETNEQNRQRIDRLKQEAVVALLQANPPAASQPDAFGRTPLHLACMYMEHCGEAVAFLLVESCPKGVTMRDMEGRTPVHYLLGRNGTIPLALLAKMVTMGPGVLDIRDEVSETPLDVTLARDDEIDNVEAVVAFLKDHQQGQEQTMEEQQKLEQQARLEGTVAT